MKVLKRIGIVLLSLIVVILITAAFLPKNFEVKRSVVINKSNTEVFGFIKYLKNQDQYSVWAEQDPFMKKTFKGTDGEVGFTSEWKSDSANVGSGSQSIIELMDNKKIVTELTFNEPFESKAIATMEVESKGENSAEVSWITAGSFPYPANIFLPFIGMDKALGTDFEKGLAKLKAILEK
jgi:hypothetical protein